MVIQCCVKGCETVANNGLHSFPANKLAAKRWIMATKTFNLIERLNTASLSHSYYKVCKRHFKETDFTVNGKGQVVVKSDSTPSLFLPDDSDLQVPQIPPVVGKALKRLQNRRSLANNIGAPSKDNHLVSVDNSSDVDVEGLSSEGEIEESLTLSRDREITICRTPKKVTNSRTSNNLSYYKRRVKELQQKGKRKKLNDSEVLQYLSTKFNTQLLEFVTMQLKNCGRSKHGRRYTPEQKSLCLAMYKQGPKSYRFNEKWCCLPTKRTLGRYSAKLMFKSGIDTKVLEAVKTIVKDWPHKDKLCTIGWDEVSLKENLQYCQSQDRIEGFVEMVKPKQPIFATHALTFMVRGIEVPYKQPIGYFYTNGGMKGFELAELVRLMIGSALTTGLVTILSVCDTCNTNANAVNELVYPNGTPTKQTGGLLQYKVNGHQLNHSFDPSHLIKVVRNNFLTKNLAHFIVKRWQSGDEDIDGSLQIAVWDDLDVLYRKDLLSPRRRLERLSEEHLKPNKLKMKVANATQVFSNTCGTYMLECVEKGKLGEDFTSTAHLLLFMNDLFDSVNGSRNQPAGSLKSALSPKSIHFEFWDYALIMLENMFFVDKADGERNNRSSVLKKFESTIRCYREVANICFNSNIATLNIRDTTQDGLENFFGCIKSCNQNNKATATQYRTGYATMTINNITGTNSLRSNCQPDESTGMLTSIHEFISIYQEQSKNMNRQLESHQRELSSCYKTSPMICLDSETEGEVNSLVAYDPQLETERTLNCDSDFLETTTDLAQYEVISNAASRVCQKLFKTTKCEECTTNFDLMDEDATLSSIEKLLGILDGYISQICSEQSIKTKLIDHVQSVEIHIIGCSDHNQAVERKLKVLAVDQAILTFCNEINKILSGKTTILPDRPSFIQKLAFEQRLKKKRIGKYSDIFIEQ